MTSPRFPPHIQRVINTAQQLPSVRDIGGFIVVEWQGRYSSYATASPHESLEAIVGTSTLALICCRFLLTTVGWEEISIEPSPCL